MKTTQIMDNFVNLGAWQGAQRACKIPEVQEGTTVLEVVRMPDDASVAVLKSAMAGAFSLKACTQCTLEQCLKLSFGVVFFVAYNGIFLFVSPWS